MRFLVMFAFFLAACGGGGRTRDPVAPAVPEAHGEVTVLLEGLAGDLEIVQGSCDKVAERLAGWVRDNRATYPDLSRRAAAADLLPEVRAEHTSRVERALSTVVTTVLGCSAHAGVQEAFSEADELLDPQ